MNRSPLCVCLGLPIPSHRCLDVRGGLASGVRLLAVAVFLVCSAPPAVAEEAAGAIQPSARLGKKTAEAPARVSKDLKPHVVFMIGEDEYDTAKTLPVFAAAHLEPRGLRCTMVHADARDGNRFPGLEALQTADVLFLSVRRRSPVASQLQLVRDFLAGGKPLVGIRTASHAFHTRGKHPPGCDEWQEFDAQVLGGNYHGHHGDGPQVAVRRASGTDHPILRGVSVESLVGHSSLYQVTPLAAGTEVLLMGEIPGRPAEPIAWTHCYRGGRVFYTSLGDPEDFQSEDFNRLLANAVFWALNRPGPWR